MTLEAALIVGITTLAAVIAILWRRDLGMQAKRDAERRSDVEHLRRDLDAIRQNEHDLIKRIRSLEDARLNEVKDYAERFERMALAAQLETRRSTDVLRHLIEMLGKRPCMIGEPAPEVDTEPLIANKNKDHA